jgi:hypothetical protein
MFWPWGICASQDWPEPLSSQTSGSKETSGSAYSIDNTALLIVDPYYDFMSEGGNVQGDIGNSNRGGFYENMRKLIPAVRASGIAVVIVPHHRAVSDCKKMSVAIKPFLAQNVLVASEG